MNAGHECRVSDQAPGFGGWFGRVVRALLNDAGGSDAGGIIGRVDQPIEKNSWRLEVSPAAPPADSFA
eukprot:3815413-Prymnesium_polylepis.1